MASYWKLWDSQGQDWMNIFKALDPIIDAFAGDRKLKVTRWRWDSPDRVLTWEDDSGKSIRILIFGEPDQYRLRISYAAWVRNGEEELFIGKAPKDEWQAVEWGKAFTEELVQHLAKAYDQVISWQSRFLKMG